MAQARAQAWLTCVTRDDSVTNALVLAESLRRSRTSKRISVITCGDHLSKENKLVLRNAFDDVFWLDTSAILAGRRTLGKRKGARVDRNDDEMECLAKIFAFSLEIFERCIFIGASTLVVENCDKLFDGFEIFKNLLGRSDTTNLFVFTPSKDLCGYLEEKIGDKRNGYSDSGIILDGIEKWIKEKPERKLMTTNKVDYMAENWEAGVMEFSMKKGRILMEKGKMDKPSIVQFVDILDQEGELVETMQLFNKTSGIGLVEKIIVKSWLNIFENNVAKILLSERNNNLVNSPIGVKPTGIYSNEPIAIIGMSCRFPGATNLEEFWTLLFEGKEGIRTPPSFRWKREHAVFGVRGKERETHAGFLPNPVEDFDAKFFGVSPKEALFLDPQARLLHEVLWESLENGGIDPQSLYGSHTGIFTGSWMNDYRDVVGRSTERDFFRTYMGNSMGATAARLSFLLGLTGPSIATESGCSSAIVAVDLAVKSLRSGETNLALVGGVNLLLHPFESNIIDYVISPDGKCKTFDEKADGFGRAEGCGVLVLKKLSDALRDRDNIWAMIRGSAVSQEGMSRSLGTPTVDCEALAMRLALKDAGVEPEQVSFVETHGTGTSVGDPMEVAALTKAYQSGNRKEPLVIGSVKTNVGHTESCSGITGIIKTVLAMQNEWIPKHLNLETLNPQINLDGIPAVIPMEPVKWPKREGERRLAGVSSFGITGTDGHVILEEKPEEDEGMSRFEWGMERPLHILKISGKTKESLEELIGLYGKKFEEMKDKPEVKGSFADAAYTGNTGRASFNYRAFILAGDYEQAVGELGSGKLMRGDATGVDSQKKICFLFSGQGSQYAGMSKKLYDSSPVFRLHFDHCEGLLREDYGMNIGKIIWGEGEGDDGFKELSRTIYSQTAIFCVEWCLLSLWRSWGIKPDIVLGHSLGEFCAAVAAGFISFEDALKLVVERSKLIDGLERGSMLVVKGSKPEVEKIMKEFNLELDFAAENSMDQSVVAGDSREIERFLGILGEKGIKGIILDATHAFHSRHMDKMLESYGTIAKGVKYAEKPMEGCQYISGMEGRLLDGASEMEADYWVRHTRNQVSFMKACEALRQLACHDFIEIGPHPVLSSFVLENLGDLGSPVTCYPSLRRGTNDWETILLSLGRLYLQGWKIDWSGFDKPYNRRKISFLPYHPFQRKPFWVETNQYTTPTVHPLIGHTLPNASMVHIFENSVTTNSIAYLKDHCVGNLILFPGAGFTEMCMAAGYCVANGLTDNLDRPRHAMQLENVRIEQPLELKEGKSCCLQTTVQLKEGEDKEGCGGGYEVKVYHLNQMIEEDSRRNWVGHASALFRPFVGVERVLSGAKWDPERIKEILERGKEGKDVEGFYKAVDNAGLKFGERFRTLKRQWREEVDGGMDEIVVEIVVPGREEMEKYVVYPTVIDAMIQSGMLSGLRSQEKGGGGGGALRVPVGIGRLTLFGAVDGGEEKEKGDGGGGVMYLHTRWINGMNCTVFLVDGDFKPVALLEGLEVIETNVKTIQSVLEIQKRELPDSWEENWRVIRGPFDNRVELQGVEPVFEEEEFKRRLEKDVGEGTKEEDEKQDGEMRRLVYLYAVKALLELGWRPEVGERWTVGEFCKRWKILGYFGKLMHFYFGMCMEEDGMMEWEKKEGIWEVKGEGLRMEEIEEEARILYEGLIKVDKLRVVVSIYKNVEGHLAKILTGEESVLPLLYPMEEKDRNQEYSAEMYYQNYPGRVEGKVKSQEVAGTLLQRLWESNGGPNNKGVLRVLEVGAGTGSMSQGMVERLGDIFGRKFEFWYTDISQIFFGKAEKKLEDWKEMVRFGIFNVEEPGLEQGIPLGYFDLVLASDVLHATKDLDLVVRNIRGAIRPGGMLYFTEILKEDRGITFVFGLFEGYWRFEDFEMRPHHCCVGGGKWRKILGRNGFKFVDIQEVYMGTVGCITAEATGEKWTRFGEEEKGKEAKRKWVVFTDGGEVAGGVVEGIKMCGGGVEEVTLPGDEDGVEEIEGKVGDALKGREDGEIQGVIYGWALNKVERDQKKIALPLMLIAKHMLNLKKPPRLYVLTRGVHSFLEEKMDGQDGESFNPSGATLFGMAKSLKNESPELFVRYVDLEGERGLGGEEAVDQVLFEVALSKEGRDKDRVQVAYRDLMRWEPRFCRGVIGSKVRDDLQLPPSTDRYQLVLPKTKVISDLSFDVLREKEGKGAGEVGDGEVEIKVKAYALNFRDLFAIMKPSAEFEGMNGVGLDFSGVVSRIGKKVDKLKVGTRVFGIHFEDTQIPSHQVVEQENVLVMPDFVTFAEAATLPAVFATSFHCLVSVAGMKEGETVLIHTGSGGVGLAAIQLAKLKGARIISTAGSPRKRRYLRGLGVEHVFHSRDTGFEKEIMRVTDGRGVDIVLNSLTGPGFKEASLGVVRRGGRFVEMSKLEVWSVEEVKGRREDVEYTIVDLTKLEAPVWRKLLTTMREWMGEGDVKPIPYVKFDALRVRQALWYLQKAKHIGKVVVTMPEVKVKEGMWNVEVRLFDVESTYVITGGMGGIGFEVCKWMLGRGARSVVLVGRGGPKEEVEREIRRLNGEGEEGIRVRVKLGDVGDLEECRRVFKEIKEECMEIRGIHHCAGVLRDNIYGNQTWESFSAPYHPKVVGCWNVHQCTVEMGLRLEHFVFYSSITAMAGTPAQANHSSANCFEDAFASWRNSMGLPGTTVNWGQWSEVGCAKEVNVTGVLPVSVRRMLNGLEEVLRGNMRQAAFGEFESLAMWSVVVPLFKNYLDERLLKDTLRGGEGGGGTVLNSDKFWEEMDEAEGKEEKIGVVGVYMKVIIRNGLRMDQDEGISDDANMKDLGVDSLMLIELKNSIQSLLGTRLTVSANMLKDCNTIRELAECIVNKLMEEEMSGEEMSELPPEELIELLRKDTVLEEKEEQDKRNALPVVDLEQVKSVLVTGCTGQLGPYILGGLAKYPVEKIICLVRTKKEGDKPEEKMERVLKGVGVEVDLGGRVTCVRGDVTQDNFGMEEKEYNELCEEVDAVVHLAVKSNHLEPYRKWEGKGRRGKDVRSVNVGGTLNVLGFCRERKIKYLYYASSILAVFGGNKEDSERLCDDWPKEVDEIKEKITGHRVPAYPLSKYVGERLIKEAGQRWGVPCKVFRFPWIMGDSKSGQLNYLSNHYILRFLSYLKIKSMPMAPLPAIILPVDVCAELSLQLFWNGEAPWEIYNIAHPEPQLEVEFREVAREEFGVELELVDHQNEEFVKKLYEKGMPLEGLKEIYQDFDRVISVTSSDSFQIIQGYLKSPEGYFKNEKVGRWLPGWEKGIDKTMEIIKRDLRYVKEKGFFTKFGL